MSSEVSVFEMYREVLGSRLAEERIIEFTKTGELGGHHPSLYHEAIGVGVGHAAYDVASREASRREAFGQPIIDNQGISFPLTDVATGPSAARMMTGEVARTYQSGGDVSVLGAVSKLYASEVAHQAVNIAVQIYGGEGYCRPCPAERLYRDQRILAIYEGTSEIQQPVIDRAIKAEASK